jgi:hypothetical protein
MECSQVYVLFTTNNLDNQTIKRQLITNFEVWLEAVGATSRVLEGSRG